MLFRYGTAPDGTLKKKAHIYTQEEHGIDPQRVDPDAVGVVKRLRREGFHAYIVGGAVRDLLVGRTPNDFDIATDAHPQKIRRIFRSARIIGRRFQIVHVYCGPQKFIEVTTFRSRASVDGASRNTAPDTGATFGTMEEDAARRDFTINALYYCPVDRQIIDYVGGVDDLRHRRLRTLIPAETSFIEDPVRMIRAAKYASLCGIPVPLPVAALIRRYRESLLSCSRERITEEVYKILTSGAARGIFDLGFRLKLFDTIFPSIAAGLHDARARFMESPLAARLAGLDEAAAAGSFLERTKMFEVLFRDLVLSQRALFDDHDPWFQVQQYIRKVSEPLFPSKKDLAQAAHAILAELHPRRLRPLVDGRGRAAAAETPAGPDGPQRRRRRRRRGGRGRGRARQAPA